MKQEQVKHQTQKETAPIDQQQETEQGPDFTEDVDAILDEIDEVLEENAEVFVAQYIQKGGQ